jgi:hypothetical protein
MAYFGLDVAKTATVRTPLTSTLCQAEASASSDAESRKDFEISLELAKVIPRAF